MNIYLHTLHDTRKYTFSDIDMVMLGDGDGDGHVACEQVLGDLWTYLPM